jgi:hypothetical protein
MVADLQRSSVPASLIDQTIHDMQAVAASADTPGKALATYGAAATAVFADLQNPASARASVPDPQNPRLPIFLANRYQPTWYYEKHLQQFVADGRERLPADRRQFAADTAQLLRLNPEMHTAKAKFRQIGPSLVDLVHQTLKNLSAGERRTTIPSGYSDVASDISGGLQELILPFEDAALMGGSPEVVAPPTAWDLQNAQADTIGLSYLAEDGPQWVAPIEKFAAVIPSFIDSAGVNATDLPQIELDRLRIASDGAPQPRDPITARLEPAIRFTFDPSEFFQLL